MTKFFIKNFDQIIPTKIYLQFNKNKITSYFSMKKIQVHFILNNIYISCNFKGKFFQSYFMLFQLQYSLYIMPVLLTFIKITKRIILIDIMWDIC